MPLKMHWLGHVPFETPGFIVDEIQRRGGEVTSSALYRGEPPLLAPNTNLLVVMGGPMGVHDETMFPWLKEELKEVESAIREGTSVLGICLGAQIIAKVLGVKVYPGPEKEIGWFDVFQTESKERRQNVLGNRFRRFTTFHWHGDTFDLPAGATCLYASEFTQNQAFAYGENVIGLQFHPEITQKAIKDLCIHCADELVDSQYIQTPAEMKAGMNKYAEINRDFLRMILDWLLNPRA